MNNILFKLGKFQSASQFLTSSLFIGLLTSVSTNILAQLPISPLLAQSQPATPTSPKPTNSNPTNNTAQRLIGQWQAKDPLSPATITFIFTPNGKLFVLPSVESDKRVAYEFGYQINPAAKPMQLDVTIPKAKQPSLTIFEFTPDGKLKVQLDGVSPGEPRPNKFSPDTPVFEKTSDTSNLPANTQVVAPDTENQASTTDKNTPEEEGKTNMGAITRAQQAYFLENNKFATTMEELAVGIKPDTDNYTYKIMAQGTERSMITAQAKRPGLRSYTGAVYVVKDRGETVTMGGICETNEPSTKPPGIPDAPKAVSDPLKCPVGSRPAR
ncbi:MAG: type IV pilin-like G/H family protein [Nostocaceae cyanobacterium]|nr:type IV pilin-like G/H family protein [Nostocaceae cyanobacterium]